VLDRSRALSHKKKHANQHAQSLQQTSAKDFKVRTLKEFHDANRPEDEGKILDIFYNNYDHLDHGDHQIEQDVSTIKVLD
jgi:hypothetical protein